MECKFWVGQKVVCVDVSARNDLGAPTQLREGGVYTVTRISGNGVSNGVKVIAVFVAEAEANGPHGFIADRFRPATDITIFKEIVAKVKDRDLIPSGVMR